MDEIRDEQLVFFDIQNLSFDHPLSFDEVKNFQELIFSLNNLSSIYFKEGIDLDSIIKIKNLITMSGVKDENIEKIVTTKLSEDDLYRLVFDNYENPYTWKIAYEREDNNYLLETIPKCREFLTYLSRIDLLMSKEKLSNLEKILRIYDIVKLLEYNDDEGNRTLPDIIIDNKSNSNEYNRLFSYILKKINIDSFLGKIKTKDNKESFITMVYVNDDKYQLDGFYLFDPSMDSLPKKIYKDDIRMINYNYFCLKLEDISYSKYKDSLIGALSILSVPDIDYSVERKKSNNNSNIEKEFTNMMDIFDMDYNEIHNKAFNTRNITINDITKLLENVYGEIDSPKYLEMIKHNYKERKNELFNIKPEEEFNNILNSNKDD